MNCNNNNNYNNLRKPHKENNEKSFAFFKFLILTPFAVAGHHNIVSSTEKEF